MSSRTDLDDDDVVDVTSLSALDAVEIKYCNEDGATTRVGNADFPPKSEIWTLLLDEIVGFVQQVPCPSATSG